MARRSLTPGLAAARGGHPLDPGDDPSRGDVVDGQG
jgi:hypothetical protein